MRQNKKLTLLQSILWSTVALVVSVFFMFLGGPIFRILHSNLGNVKYMLFALLFTFPFFIIGMVPAGFFILSLWMVVGLYGAFERGGRSGFWAGFTAVLIATAVGTLGPWLFLKSQNIDFVTEYSSVISGVMQSWKSKSANQLTEADYKFIAETSLMVVPGGISVVLMAVLGVAVIFAERFSNAFGVRVEKVAGALKPIEFRVPDIFVWLTMFSFLFCFLKVGGTILQVLALNTFVFMMGVYFFQGIAIMEVGFRAFHVGSFLRLMIYLLIAGNLFFIVSLVGFADFWLDFRARWRSRLISTQNENGEWL